jgi:hypothetical protein
MTGPRRSSDEAGDGPSDDLSANRRVSPRKKTATHKAAEAQLEKEQAEARRAAPNKPKPKKPEAYGVIRIVDHTSDAQGYHSFIADWEIDDNDNWYDASNFVQSREAVMDYFERENKDVPQAILNMWEDEPRREPITLSPPHPSDDDQDEPRAEAPIPELVDSDSDEDEIVADVVSEPEPDTHDFEALAESQRQQQATAEERARQKRKQHENGSIPPGCDWRELSKVPEGANIATELLQSWHTCTSHPDPSAAYL